VVVQHQQARRFFGDPFKDGTRITEINDDDPLSGQIRWRRLSMLDRQESSSRISFPYGPSRTEPVGAFGMIENQRGGVRKHVAARCSAH
jgi:hypothetical protein